MLGLSQIFGKETIVGLDIGSRMIKIVQCEAGTGGAPNRIVKAAVGLTPHEAVRDGIVVDRDAVAQAVRELMKLAHIEASGASAAVSGASVIVRHVKMPKMNETVLRKGIRYEAAKYISSATEDSMIEFEITGEVPTEDDKMGVMLIAVPKDMVESRLAALTGAGLEPVAVDIEPFALQRAILDVDSSKSHAGATVALLDIGAVTTDVNIITDGQFALTRNIPIAGDNFTNALKTVTHKTDWNELELSKLSVDMSALLDPDSDPTAIAMAQAVQPSVDELLREVRRSINYYQSQLVDLANSNLPPGVTMESGGGTVSRIIVSGGSAKLGGLSKYMTARLGIPVDIWTLTESVNFDVSALPESFVRDNDTMLSTGIGLALKESCEAMAAPPVVSTRKFKIGKAA